MEPKVKHPAVALLTAAVVGLQAIACAPNVRPSEAPTAFLVDRIVVYKTAHKMRVFRGEKPLREFHVALGRGGLGPKVRNGDNRVPEGRYFIAGHNSNSAFHLSLRISYPTPEQAKAAKTRGFDPGGDIMIHGLPNGHGWIGAAHRRTDWTRGCVAVTNEEVEWLWRIVADGTPIDILP